MNKQLDDWLRETANSRLHGTTGAIPAERLEQEKPTLIPLPVSAYLPMISLGRRVTRDGYVSYNGNDYSVPEGILKSDVTVLATLEEVQLYQDDKLIATHPVQEGRGQRRLDPGHRHQQSSRPNTKASLADIMELIEVQRRPLEIYDGVLQ